MKLLLVLLALLVGGCASTSRRISEHSAAYAALDPATQKNIQAGVLQPGYTPDMVYMAAGKPTEVRTNAAGQTVWLYRVHPVAAHNETILGGGFRRRTVYDPITRTDTVVVEPIDEKAFPHLIPHTLKMTFQNDRLLSVERINGIAGVH